MPRIAANLAYLFTERPLLERFGAAASAGFKTVELQFPYDHAPSVVKAEIDRYGLTQLGLNTAQGRVCSPMVSVTEAGEPTESVTLFSEVAMAPFAWTLSFTGDGRQPLSRTADVSHWLKLGPSETASAMPLVLPVGTIASAVPGDYSFRDVIHAP